MKHLLLLLLLASPAFGGIHRIADHGAIANDNKPDTQAFRNAFAAAMAECGGTVVVPRGEFLVDGTVAPNQNEKGSCGSVPLSFVGEVGAVVRIAVGSDKTAFAFSWLQQVVQVRDLTFIGSEVTADHPQFVDAKTVFYFGTLPSATVSHCSFINLAVPQRGALLAFASGKYEIAHTHFQGSTALYAADIDEGGAFILGDNDGQGNAWNNITVRKSTFSDYANFQQRFLSKSHEMAGAFIRTKALQPQSGAAVVTGRLVVIDTFFDEGAHTAIYAKGTPSVDLQGVSVNVNNTLGATGVRLVDVGHAVVLQNVGDWVTNHRPYLTTRNVKFVKVSGLDLRANTAFWHNQGGTNMLIEYCETCAERTYRGRQVPNEIIGTRR